MLRVKFCNYRALPKCIALRPCDYRCIALVRDFARLRFVTLYRVPKVAAIRLLEQNVPACVLKDSVVALTVRQRASKGRAIRESKMHA